MSSQEPIHCGDGLRPIQDPEEQVESTLASVSRTITIENSLGLHMRPVMQFVDLANQFKSRIWVQKDKHVVDGKNPMEMMLLEAVQGTSLEIRAEGDDAEDAIQSLVELVEAGFGED